MIKKIISGGQTGADLGGLIGAKKAGIETGGTMPKFYKNEDGFNPSFRDEYNIETNDSPEYPPRTKANVQNSDGTLRFARDFNTRGEWCTLRFIKSEGKPHFDIDILTPPTVEKVAQWLKEKNIEVLNVAGNSESRCRGIQQFVATYIETLLKHQRESDGKASNTEELLGGLHGDE